MAPRMTERAPPRVQSARARGYTLIELVIVMAVVAILAVYVAPRFWTQQSFSDRGYADELAAALRAAQKAAVISGCPAELILTAAGYSAAQQAASGNACNPSDTSWSTPLLGADGSTIQDSAPSGTTAAPTGTFEFDSQGRLIADPGTTLSVGTHTITLVPGTGLVEVE